MSKHKASVLQVGKGTIPYFHSESYMVSWSEFLGHVG